MTRAVGGGSPRGSWRRVLSWRGLHWRGPHWRGLHWRGLHWLGALTLVFLLVALAALQERWLRQVSAAERESRRNAIANATQAYAREFNDLLGRLALDFVGPLEGLGDTEGSRQRTLQAAAAHLGERSARWRRSADEPALLAAVWLVELDGGPPRLRAFDPDRGAFAEAAWPAALDGVRADLMARRPGGPGFDPLAAEAPALVLPLIPTPFLSTPLAPSPPAPPAPPLPPPAAAPELSEPFPAPPFAAPPPAFAPSPRTDGRRPEAGIRPPRPRGPGTPATPEGLRPDDLQRPPTYGDVLSRPGAFGPSDAGAMPRWRFGPGERPRWLVVLQLDRRFLFETYLPALAGRHFPAGDLRLRIVDRDDGAAVFAWPTGDAPAGAAQAEAVAELFGPVLGDLLPSRARVRFGGLPGGPPAGPPADLAGRWRLEVSHPEGSLDAVVEGARRRNLALGFGILAVLAGALLALGLAARNARRLASQQMELVAGITHELLTPLAALRSAGQNLRDGVVREPAKVARYGELIVAEGTRLSDLVGQVLSFAGLAGDQSLRREPLAPRTVLERVLDDLRPTLETADVDVRLEAATDLPPVLADDAALRRALGNLVSNAVKYGRPAEGRPWLGLAARASGDRRSVDFEVADRGPGIAAEDLPQIFEPFYRGRAVVASATPGTGIGLALVRRLARAMGGEVAARSVLGGGALFVLTLPASTADG